MENKQLKAEVKINQVDNILYAQLLEYHTTQYNSGKMQRWIFKQNTNPYNFLLFLIAKWSRSYNPSFLAVAILLSDISRIHIC